LFESGHWYQIKNPASQEVGFFCLVLVVGEIGIPGSTD
jgi:hypothetical protein